MNQEAKGQLIVVVGASGAGKDSVIKAAQEHFASNSRIAFVRRIITRECDPASEVHDSVTESEFKQMQDNGAFSVYWQANGLHYGLPMAMHGEINNGQILIANGSRAALDAIRSTFSQLTTVHITVTEDALLHRLARRKRESADEIQQRLERNRSMPPLQGDDVVSIDNSGERHEAIDEFIKLVDSV